MSSLNSLNLGDNVISVSRWSFMWEQMVGGGPRGDGCDGAAPEREHPSHAQDSYRRQFLSELML